MRLARESPLPEVSVPDRKWLRGGQQPTQALNTTLIPPFRETTLRETITPSRPSNNSVHNLDIKSDIMHWPGWQPHSRAGQKMQNAVSGINFVPAHANAPAPRRVKLRKVKLSECPALNMKRAYSLSPHVYFGLACV